MRNWTNSRRKKRPIEMRGRKFLGAETVFTKKGKRIQIDAYGKQIKVVGKENSIMAERPWKPPS